MEELTWEVIHLPGHSIGSIGLYYPPEKVLVPGNVHYADHAIGRFDLFSADGSMLKESLRRLFKMEITILLPGQNGTVMNLPAGYILKT